MSDLYLAAEAWLRSCTAASINVCTLARKLDIDRFTAEHLADQLEDGGVLGSARPPYGQRPNFVRKRSDHE